MIKTKWICVLMSMILLVSCAEEYIETLYNPPGFTETPKGFEAMDYPSENSHTDERWALGKKLYFDPIMSLDSSISCGSCHNPSLAFSDEISLSLGVENRLGTRNAPTLANVGYHPYYTREGGVPTLEMQIFVPIQEHNEFDFNIVLLAERMMEDSTYIKMSLDAYDRLPDPFTITRSLATFERSLISGYSQYDQYENYNIENALSESEKAGMMLFFSDRTNCSSCHNGFNFTNYAFENNGLYEEYNDVGRFRFTGDENDKYKFKTPTLRNIALTAPYMYDGSIENLEDVIDHYNNGGAGNPIQNPLIRPLGLTSKEKSELVAFLKALTDESFINNPIFKN